MANNNWYLKILDEFHKERNTRAFYTTQGFKKLWNYTQEITQKDNFQESIKIIRKKYNIPENGFMIKTTTWTHPPKIWKHYENNFFVLNEIHQKLKILCKKYKLPIKDWLDIFEKYLFYNKLQLCLKPNSHNLCLVSDLITKVDSVGHKIGEDEISSYPVAFQISPYATKRDIIDYIAKLYKTEIRPLQEKHKNQDINIGKYKKRNLLIRKRNDFIYEHKNLPFKKIMELTNNFFSKVGVDHGGVGKIISLEKKRRKGV